MQFTAAAIHAGLHAAGETDWSLEDVCCYVPVWLGTWLTCGRRGWCVGGVAGVWAVCSPRRSRLSPRRASVCSVGES